MRTISGEEFDRRFDAGEDMGDYLEPISEAEFARQLAASKKTG